jgi:hypothetical protein
MTRLEEALERLERAVARLEAAHNLDTAGMAGPPIAKRLAEAEAENRRLRDAASEIAARVDNALATVGRALEGEA